MDRLCRSRSASLNFLSLWSFAWLEGSWADIYNSVLSLLYGRRLTVNPTSTLNDRLALPAVIDDEYLSLSSDCFNSQPQGVPSLAECYVEAVKLQDILGQVLAVFYGAISQERSEKCINDTMYGPSESSSAGIRSFQHTEVRDGIKNVDFQAVMDLDALLNSWHKKLPTHLQLQTYDQPHPLPHVSDPHRIVLFRRQASVLESR